MKQSLIERIVAFLFGNKYYANIVNSVGTNRCEVCNFIFNTKQQAEQHREAIMGTASFHYVETVSFRSRNEYTCRYPDISTAK